MLQPPSPDVALLRKGTMMVGSDADIVLFDHDETWTIGAAK
jgi:dihydroorotase-like cyclic amidohydrolase